MTRKNRQEVKHPLVCFYVAIRMATTLFQFFVDTVL